MKYNIQEYERCQTMHSGSIEDILIGVTKPSMDRLLKMQNPADCIALYTYYCYVRKWQNNVRVRAVSSFAMKALDIGRDRFSVAKKQLVEAGFVEDYFERKENGESDRWYIKVRYAMDATLGAFGTVETEDQEQLHPTENQHGGLPHPTENPHSGKTQYKYPLIINETPFNGNDIIERNKKKELIRKSSNPPDLENKPPEQPEGKVMSATAEQKTTPSSAPPPPQYSAEFETFWTAYPRKIGKQAAFREWKRCKVDLSTALKAIDQQRKAGMFKEQQFIIYPERWIKNGRWEEIETAPQLRVNAPVASSNPQAGSSCHRIKSEGLEDAFWNWFQIQREWEERRNLRTVDDVWLDQFLLSLSEEF
jgi:hypothetical protein